MNRLPHPTLSNFELAMDMDPAPSDKTPKIAFLATRAISGPSQETFIFPLSETGKPI